jgi:hypothetical protein
MKHPTGTVMRKQFLLLMLPATLAASAWAADTRADPLMVSPSWLLP